MARQLMTMEQILSILLDAPDRIRCLTGDLTEARLHAWPRARSTRSSRSPPSSPMPQHHGDFGPSQHVLRGFNPAPTIHRYTDWPLGRGLRR